MPITRILVIRLGAMGDLVHAASAVQWIKRQYPSVEVDWLTSPLYVPLLQRFQTDGKPLLREVFGYDKKQAVPGLLNVAGQLRKQGYDAVVNLHPAIKTWLLAHYAVWGGPARISRYRKEKMPIQGEGQRALSRRHAVEDFLQPFLTVFPGIDNMDMAGLSRQMPPVLSLPSQGGEKPNTPVLSLIVGVGQKRGNRGWPLDAYRQLIRLALEKSDAEIILIGGPEEVETGQVLAQVFDGESRVQNACGKYPLLETAAILRDSTVIVGGDTGPLHLASCFDVPIIGLFGPTSVTRTGALGPEHRRVHLTPHEDLSCWPCELPTCPLPAEQNLACMRETTPEIVWAAVARYL